MKYDFDTLIQGMIHLNNQHVDEFNTLYDTAEQLGKDLNALTETQAKSDEVMKAQHKALLKSSEDLEKQKNLISSLSVYESKADQLETELKKLRKEHKTLKEQSKRLKVANAAKQKQLEKLTKQSKSSGIQLDKDKFITNPDLGWLYTVATYKDELLQVYPHRLTLRLNQGQETEQYTLLYTDRTGTFLTVMLEDGQAVFGSPLIFPKGTPERTQRLATKFVPHPHKVLRDFATVWLNRVNLQQGAKLKPTDLQKHELGDLTDVDKA